MLICIYIYMCNYDIKYNIYNIWLSICVSCIFTLNHHGEQWGLQSIILVSGMSYPSPVMLGSVKTSRLSLSPGLKWSLPPNDPSGVAEQAIRVEPQEMKGIETWWDKPLIIKISYKKCPLKKCNHFQYHLKSNEHAKESCETRALARCRSVHWLMIDVSITVLYYTLMPLCI